VDPGTIDELERKLRAVMDKQEIHEVLMRYCRGIDRCDEALVLSAFHEDATDNHTGPVEMVAERVPRVIEMARTTVKGTSHNLCNELVELDGDVAHAESYLLAYHRIEHEGRELDWILGARYLDRLERRAGEWRIAHRTVVNDWQRFDDVGPLPRGLKESTYLDHANQAKRTREDVSYRSIPPLKGTTA
jgi:ketosteroid isomerase-like protein